jgi:ammonium transporter, Amt family
LYSAGPAAGLFYGGGIGQLWVQFLGVITVGGMTVLVSSIFWIVLKAVLGIRVDEEEEMIGLDISEHGMEAYSGFVKDASGTGGSRASAFPSGSQSSPSNL